MVSKLFNIYTAKAERGQKIMADVKKYLDLNGLETLWGQVKIYVQNSINGNNSTNLAELQRQITEEIARATGAEGELRTAIENEVQARIDAVSELTKKISDETKRAEGVEAELRGLVDAINNPDTGILAKAKAYVAEREGVLNGKIGEVETALEAEVARAQAAETGLQDAINTLNGGEAVEGSVSKKIKDAVDTINGNIDGVKGRVDALEGEMASIPGSIEAAKNEAKRYAEEKITDLVGGAPEAMDTLKELAQAIEEHQEVYEGYVQTVAGDIARAKSEAIAEAGKLDNALKAELNSTIETEANRAKAAEKKLTDDLAAEVVRATEQESELLAKITSEVSRLEGEDSKLLQAINAETSAREEAIQGVNNSIGAVRTRVETLENAGYQTAVQVGTAIDNKINELNLPGTYEVKGAAAQALVDAKSYVDGEISRRVVALTNDEIMSILGK